MRCLRGGRAGAALLLAAGLCSCRPAQVAHVVHAAPDINVANVEKPLMTSTSANAPEVEASLLDSRPGKPPLKYLKLDLHLRNPSDQARWFLLPTKLPQGPGGPGVPGGGVNSLRVMEHEGAQARVLVGRFSGTGGLQAVRLAPHAEVRIGALPVSYWGDLDGGAWSFEVRIAAGLTIGGTDASEWFGEDPTSPARADVNREAALRVRDTPDGAEVPLGMTETRVVIVQVPAAK